jgi:hypothetical protein
MLLTTQQSHDLLQDHGVFVRDCCDKCGQLLGPVRFTRRSDSGVWCSRECRDGTDAHAPGTCRACGASLAGLRRGAKFCSDVCRMRLSRKNGESQTRQIIPNEPLETQDLQGGLGVLAIPSHSGALGA